MTEKESYLVELFRSLDRYEQNIIIGKISELILNRKRGKKHYFDEKNIKYIPVVFVFIY